MSEHPEFQSLSRDSWWSNNVRSYGPLHRREVSIPQSGFLVVKLDRATRVDGGHGGFNPSVGILGGQTQATLLSSALSGCFNPSVGILGGQTRSVAWSSPCDTGFQSLSRDSWWSNPARPAVSPPS